MDASSSRPRGAAAALRRTVERLRATRPARVLQRYSDRNGPVLAAGLAFQGLFAVFAGIWVGFSVLGLVAAGDPGVRDAVVRALASAVPGLIDDGSGGVVSPARLLKGGEISVTGAVALVGLLVTAVGFLGSLRSAIRGVLGLPAVQENPVLAKLRDLGLAIGFGLLVLLSAALGVAGTAATDWLLGLIGIDSGGASAVGRVVTIALAFLVDAVTLGAVFRLVAWLRLPLRRMASAVLLGAAGLGLLKTLGGALLGGASKNPLLASFAVLVGVLIFFGFVGQVLLLSAAWLSVSLDDHGVDADPDARPAALTAARGLLEAAGFRVLDPGAATPRRGLFARLRRRRESGDGARVGGGP